MQERCCTGSSPADHADAAALALKQAAARTVEPGAPPGFLQRLASQLLDEVPTATHVALYWLADPPGLPGAAAADPSAAFRVYRLAASAGEPALSDSVIAGEGLLGFVAESGQTLDVDDPEAEERTLTCYLEARSDLIVPIRVDARTVGLIHLRRSDLGSWGPSAKRAGACLAEALAERLVRRERAVDAPGVAGYNGCAVGP